MIFSFGGSCWRGGFTAASCFSTLVSCCSDLLPRLPLLRRLLVFFAPVLDSACSLRDWRVERLLLLSVESSRVAFWCFTLRLFVFARLPLLLLGVRSFLVVEALVLVFAFAWFFCFGLA